MLTKENTTQFQIQTLHSHDRTDRDLFSLILKGTFEIIPNQPACWASRQLPINEWDEYNHPDKPGSIRFENDLIPFKPKTDVIYVGKAFAQNGVAVPQLIAGIRVGSTERQIVVFGNRHWVRRGFVLETLSPSEPEPFLEMPIEFERAFGGQDLGEKCQGEWSDWNPIGTGVIARKNRSKAHEKPLPNIEDPEHLIQHWRDRPKPVGFGVYGPGWKPRVQYAGTYDNKWRKERDPKLPLDFQYEFYNTAHPDLQFTPYLTGEEEIGLTNLSPASCQLSFKLPGIKPTACVAVSDARSDEVGGTIKDGMIELQLNLDTLYIIAEENLIYQIWRGILPLAEGSEVSHIAVNL